MPRCLFRCFCGLILSLLVCKVSCATWDTVKDEHVKLYDAYSVSSLHSYTDTIPNNDFSAPLEVSLEMEMTSLGDYDAVNGAIDIIGSINMSWTDHISTLGSVSFDYTSVSEILLDYRKLWTPVIVLINSADSVKRVGDEAYKVRFNLGTGQVSWKPRMIIRASCTPDVSFFPFDQQKCEFLFAPWFLTSDKLKLTVSSNTWNMDNYDKNGVWEIESTESTAFVSGDFYYASFTLTFNRAPTYFVMTLVLPILFLSLLSGLVFLLPAASGERVGFVITCFLTFVVLLQTTMTFLPQASAPMSLLCYYVIVMMVFSAFLSLANALLLRVYHKPKGEEVPRWLIHVMEVIKCIKCRRIICRKKYNSVEDSRKNISHRPSFKTSTVTPVRAVFNSKRIEPSLRQITSLKDVKQNVSKNDLSSKLGAIQPETSFTIDKEVSKHVLKGTKVGASLSENENQMNGIITVGSSLIDESGIKKEDSKPVLNGIKNEVSSSVNENQMDDKNDGSSLRNKSGIRKEDPKPTLNGIMVQVSSSENEKQTNDKTLESSLPNKSDVIVIKVDAPSNENENLMNDKKDGSSLTDKLDIKKEDSKPVLNGNKIEVSSIENENDMNDKKDGLSLTEQSGIKKEDSNSIVNGIMVKTSSSENENELNDKTVGSSLSNKSSIKKENSKHALNDIKVEASLSENENQMNGIKKVGSNLTNKSGIKKEDEDSKPVLNNTKVEASLSEKENQMNGIKRVGSSLTDKSGIKKEDSKPVLNGIEVKASLSENENQMNGIKRVGSSLPDKPGRKEAFSEAFVTTTSESSDDDENEIDWDSIGRVLDIFFLLVFIGVQCAFSIFFLVPLGSRA